MSALALALLWAVVPALASIHGVLEAHVYCADHDAFEHGGAAHASESTSITARSGSEPMGEDHERCALADAMNRVALEGVSADQSCCRLDPPAIAVTAGDVTDRPQLAILATAPKGSPPA